MALVIATGSEFPMAHRVNGPMDSDTIIASLWIDRSGNCYYVPSCDHETVANAHFHTTVSDLEDRGFIHFSLYWTGYIANVDVRPTEAQIDTILSILYGIVAELNGIPQSMHDVEIRKTFRVFTQFLADNNIRFEL